MPTDIEITIGKNIAEARKALGWTQSDLAKRSGLSRSYVARIESFNARNVTSSRLHKIAATFGVPTFMLMMDKNDWKALVDVIFPDGPYRPQDLIEKYLDSEERISVEDVERIEAFSASPRKGHRRTAVAEINTEVSKVVGRDPTVRNAPQESIERSMTAATGMATAMIPSDPIVNGVIAFLISTHRSPSF